MAEQRHIDEQIDYLKDKSDAELLKLIGEQQPFAAGRIAATQLMHERKQEEARKSANINKDMFNYTVAIFWLTLIVLTVTIYFNLD